MFDEVKAYKIWCQFYCANFLGHPVHPGRDVDRGFSYTLSSHIAKLAIALNIVIFIVIVLSQINFFFFFFFFF